MSSALIVPLGKPVHLKRQVEDESVSRTACGIRVHEDTLAAWDIRHVECFRCRRTMYFKNRKDLDASTKEQ